MRTAKQRKSIKELREFERACEQYAHLGLTIGTAPTYHAKTHVFIECKVMMQAGPKVLMISAVGARKFATDLRTQGAHMPDVVSLANDLDEMAEIAERMNIEKPTFEQTAERIIGPSREVH